MKNLNAKKISAIEILFFETVEAHEGYTVAAQFCVKAEFKGASIVLDGSFDGEVYNVALNNEFYSESLDACKTEAEEEAFEEFAEEFSKSLGLNELDDSELESVLAIEADGVEFLTEEEYEQRGQNGLEAIYESEAEEFGYEGHRVRSPDLGGIHGWWFSATKSIIRAEKNNEVKFFENSTIDVSDMWNGTNGAEMMNYVFESLFKKDDQILI